MPVVAFAGLEPKSGKTTCAVLVASALTNRGGRVLLVDADPRQHALLWSNKAQARELKTPTVIAAPNAAALVADLGARFDITILDLPPDADVQRDACAVADVVVTVRSAPKSGILISFDDDDGGGERSVTVVARVPPKDAHHDDPAVAAVFVADAKYGTTLQFGTVTTHGDLGDLVAPVEKLASIVARRADVFDFEVTGEIPQPFVRIAIPPVLPPPSSAADATVAVDMKQFLRDMDTFVGVIERSFIDTLSSSSSPGSSSSTDESPATMRERLRAGLDHARTLLGLHFQNGETFVVNDGAAFFDAAIAADRVIATANGLLDDMERKNESTVMRPSIESLAQQVRDLVTHLRELRG